MGVPYKTASISGATAVWHLFKRKARGVRSSSAARRGVSVSIPDGSALCKLRRRPALEDVRAALQESGLQSMPVRDLLHMVANQKRGHLLLSTMQVLMEEQMRHLNIPFRLRPENPGRLQLSFGERDLVRLQRCFQNQACLFSLPACRVLVMGKVGFLLWASEGLLVKCACFFISVWFPFTRCGQCGC